MNDLDSQIDEQHRQIEAAEEQARAIEARICRISGADRLIPRRQYGTPIAGSEVAKNLTLRGLICRDDPALASFLGLQNGGHREREAAEAERAAQVARMQQLTAEAQAANAASARYRERMALAGLNPITHRRGV